MSLPFPRKAPALASALLPGGAIISALLLLMLSAIPINAAAQSSQRVRVQLRGVTGKLEQRVRTALSIDEAASAGRIEPTELQRLHDVAAAEIKRALEVSGHYRGTVRAELLDEGGAKLARYTIEPGPPVRLTSVDVRLTGEGASDSAFVDQARRFPLRAGEVLDHVSYELGKQTLLVHAAENGYLDARFETHRINVNLERNEARIELLLDTGERFAFGEVRFEPDVLDSRLLESYVPFERGDPLRARGLIDLQTKLSELPYFARVEVQPMRVEAEGDQVPIKVTLITRKATRFSSGVGYGTDTGPHLRLAAELRRLNRRGHRAEISGRLAEIEKTIELQYAIPRVAGRDQLLTISGGFADLRPVASHSRTVQLGVGLLRRRGAWNEVVSLSFKRERFDVGLDAGVTRFLIPDLSWTTVRRDDPIDTKVGHRVRLGLRGSHGDVLSDVSFAQVDAQAKLVRSLSRRQRVLARLQGGQTWVDEFAKLPATLRYFAGGVQSVRGFDYNTLAPLGLDGRVIGGERLLTGSLEYELRLLDTWGIAAFFDAGNAFGTDSFELETGAGFGLRWASPIGLVRVDAALPSLDRNKQVRFHLNIGPDL